MTTRASLAITFASPEDAQRASQALRPDDDAYVRTHVVGPALRTEVQAPDIPGLVRALDDVLAQVSVFEDLLRDAGRPPMRA